MTGAFYIVVLRQIGNIGANEIKKIEEQPAEGFATELLAEEYMSTARLHRFYHKWYTFAIMKLYNFEK